MLDGDKQIAKIVKYDFEELLEALYTTPYEELWGDSIDIWVDELDSALIKKSSGANCDHVHDLDPEDPRIL